MIRRFVIAMVSLTLLVSACTATNVAKPETRITGTKKKATGKAVASPKAVTVSLMVQVLGPAPDALAKHAAALVGIPAPATYALAQAAGGFVPVQGAEVMLRDPAGRSLSGSGVKTDKDGNAGLPAIFSNVTLAFVEATYTVDGARLTLSAVVPSPKELKTATIDPATTLIAKKLSYLGRIREIDLGAYPADMAGKLAAPLAAQLGEVDIAAAAVLDPEQAARALDALLAKDAEIKPALATAAGGETVAYKAIVNVTPKIVVTPTPRPGVRTPRPTEKPTPTPTPRPSGVPVIPTPIPTRTTPTPAGAGTPTPAPTPTPIPTATPTPGV